MGNNNYIQGKGATDWKKFLPDDKLRLYNNIKIAKLLSKFELDVTKEKITEFDKITKKNGK